MQAPILVFLTLLLAGAATALQGPTNARLVTAVGSPLNAAFVSFAVGTVALGVLAMILQARPDVGAMKALPWWAWMGGLYGCAFVVSAAWGVPRLGVATTITVMIAGQLLLSLALDHFGALGVEKQPLSLGRIAGVALVIGGVVLVRRS
jgi:transporter family-2 protein